jgi:hypothetical protein
VEFTSELENQIFPGSEPMLSKTGKIMQGRGNQYGCDMIEEAHSVQMSYTNACPVENNRISRKKDRNGIFPRLDNSRTIVKYAIVDVFDRNHVHSACHFFDLRARFSKVQIQRWTKLFDWEGPPPQVKGADWLEIMRL